MCDPLVLESGIIEMTNLYYRFFIIGIIAVGTMFLEGRQFYK